MILPTKQCILSPSYLSNSRNTDLHQTETKTAHYIKWHLTKLPCLYWKSPVRCSLGLALFQRLFNVWFISQSNNTYAFPLWSL